MSLAGGRLAAPAEDWTDRLAGLASQAAHTSFHAAPPEVAERLVELVVDTLAVTSWGSRRPELVALRDVVTRDGAPGGATVLGDVLPRPASVACTLNGSAAAADQLQDGHRMARGHPATHVVLAVLALAEEMDATTEEFLSAVLGGYELGARIGLAMHGTPPGVHDIGTWGSIAVAAGTARLLAPHDPDAMRRAVELAASAVLLTDSTTIFTGHTGGHAYLGASVAHGLWLGQAAVAGLEAAPGSLERFFAAHAAHEWRGLPDVADSDPGRWPSYEVLQGYIKLHPTCAHLHGILDALDDAVTLLEEQGAPEPEAHRVQRVEVRTYAVAATFLAPAHNELQARFSIPTAVALALIHGGLTDSALTDHAARSPATRDLASRVDVVVDAELDSGYPHGRPSTVTLLLDDGSRVTSTSLRPRGDADADASRVAIQDKASRLLAASFGQRSDDLADVIAGWPSRHTPRELGAAFRLAATLAGEART
ncbi:MmgE/PrpD family protein [Knoellia locipacati]|uniref:MmgE/PrpD family protein n=1 Tax=Knoellia locipacati TaxID=882824 RepID=UPI003851180B